MRQKGQSQLDYLWANFGSFAVSDNFTDNPEGTILSQKALEGFIKETNGIDDLKIVETNEGPKLVAYTNGVEVANLSIPSGVSIQAFGRRTITQADKNKGCALDLGTQVYYIMLSNGNEYLTPTVTGKDTKSIALSLVENAIYADLKINNQDSIVELNTTPEGIQARLRISNDSSSIILSEDVKGLRGDIVLNGANKFLQFSLVTLEEYNSLPEKDETTMYFIKGKPFFYFGDTLMMGETSGTVDLDNYYNKQDIDQLLSNYVTHPYLQGKLDELNWNNI